MIVTESLNRAMIFVEKRMFYTECHGFKTKHLFYFLRARVCVCVLCVYVYCVCVYVYCVCACVRERAPRRQRVYNYYLCILFPDKKGLSVVFC